MPSVCHGEEKIENTEGGSSDNITPCTALPQDVTPPKADGASSSSSSQSPSHTLREIMLKSPMFTTDVDDPKSHIMTLTPLERVQSVSVRSGDLIDSVRVTIVTKHTDTHKVVNTVGNTLTTTQAATATQSVTAVKTAGKIQSREGYEEVVGGVTTVCGPSQGGVLRSLTIPLGWTFLGFYGGRGGHLHNIGVVLKRDY